MLCNGVGYAVLCNGDSMVSHRSFTIQASRGQLSLAKPPPQPVGINMVHSTCHRQCSHTTVYLKQGKIRDNSQGYIYRDKHTCPACDSDPGMLPNPPSKFIHETTKLTALFMSTASNRFLGRNMHSGIGAKKAVNSSNEC